MRNTCADPQLSSKLLKTAQKFFTDHWGDASDSFAVDIVFNFRRSSPVSVDHFKLINHIFKQGLEKFVQEADTPLTRLGKYQKAKHDCYTMEVPKVLSRYFARNAPGLFDEQLCTQILKTKL